MAKQVSKGIPPKPDLNLYEHLTEKERMNAGFPYRPADDQLNKERTDARKLIRKYNMLEVDDEKGRQEILDELLNPACRGKKLFIEAPFRVDYGWIFYDLYKIY